MADLTELARTHWAATHDVGAILIVLSGALLLCAFLLASRFHPPGEGYAQEAREWRIASVCTVLGFVCVAGFVLILVITG